MKCEFQSCSYSQAVRGKCISCLGVYFCLRHLSEHENQGHEIKLMKPEKIKEEFQKKIQANYLEIKKNIDTKIKICTENILNQTDFMISQIILSSAHLLKTLQKLKFSVSSIIYQRMSKSDLKYQELNKDLLNDTKIFVKIHNHQNLVKTEKKFPDSKICECSCGNVNADEFELCTKCNTSKTGVNKWVCNKCSGVNEITTIICELCGDGYKSQSSFQNKFEPRHHSISKNISHNRENNIRARDKTLGSFQSLWVCKCSQKNSQDYEACSQCFELKPGLSGWICKKCKLKNDEYSWRCLSCRASKEGGLIFDQEFWICEKCKTAISNLTSFCDTCMISRSNTGFDEKCKICFKNKVYFMDKCLPCYMMKKKDEPPNREEIKSDSKWKCKYCPCWNNEWESKCRSCSSFKDMNDTSKWICFICAKENFVSDNICWYCKTMKEKNKEIEINKTKCQKCGMSIDYVRCVKCGKLENYLLGFCGACKSDLSSITTCYTCFKPDWINSYGKMNEPQPNNPAEKKLGSLYKSFNSRY